VVLGGDLTFNLGAELGPILRHPVRRPPPQARTAKYSAPHSASQLVTANVKLFTSDWICFFYLPPVAFVRYRSPFFLFLLGRSPSTPDSPIHTHSKPRDATRSSRDGTSCGREQDGEMAAWAIRPTAGSPLKALAPGRTSCATNALNAISRYTTRNWLGGLIHHAVG
jgi:hypothetical protein